MEFDKIEKHYVGDMQYIASCFQVLSISDPAVGDMYIAFFLGEPHLPHHLCPLLDLCDPRAHDCFSCGDRFLFHFSETLLTSTS